MNDKYRLSIHAEKDLAGIYDYTLKTWGEQQLRRYHRILKQALEMISKDPVRPGSKAREELFPGCRSFHAGRHVILYRNKDNLVEVARILHQSMDLKRHVPEEC